MDDDEPSEEIKVTKNKVLPSRKRMKRKYPFLEVGDGFELPCPNAEEAKKLRSAVYNSYLARGQQINTVFRDELLHVKRMN